MKSHFRVAPVLLIGLAAAFPAQSQSQSTSDQGTAATQPTAPVKQKGRSAGGEIGSGSGDIGKGVAKGAGNLAVGTGKIAKGIGKGIKHIF